MSGRLAHYYLLWNWTSLLNFCSISFQFRSTRFFFSHWSSLRVLQMEHIFLIILNTVCEKHYDKIDRSLLKKFDKHYKILKFSKYGKFQIRSSKWKRLSSFLNTQNKFNVVVWIKIVVTSSQLNSWYIWTIEHLSDSLMKTKVKQLNVSSNGIYDYIGMFLLRLSLIWWLNNHQCFLNIGVILTIFISESTRFAMSHTTLIKKCFMEHSVMKKL